MRFIPVAWDARLLQCAEHGQKTKPLSYEATPAVLLV